MTESERHEIMAKLIELEFRSGYEEGDPTADESAAAVLLSRMQNRLAAGALLSCDFCRRESDNSRSSGRRGDQQKPGC